MVMYLCPFDASNTETKETVLIKSAEELKNFNQGEENLIEAVSLIKRAAIYCTYTVEYCY